jgi:hypothetical protein
MLSPITPVLVSVSDKAYRLQQSNSAHNSQSTEADSIPACGTSVLGNIGADAVGLVAAIAAHGW